MDSAFDPCDGGFQTTITITNSHEEDGSLSLQPYLEDGTALNAVLSVWPRITFSKPPPISCFQIRTSAIFPSAVIRFCV